jgi:hypothetical protein
VFIFVHYHHPSESGEEEQRRVVEGKIDKCALALSLSWRFWHGRRKEREAANKSVCVILFCQCIALSNRIMRLMPPHPATHTLTHKRSAINSSNFSFGGKGISRQIDTVIYEELKEAINCLLSAARNKE